ncbi:MAG: hypothetical protein EPN20_07075 [Magnetospirillum sp.]|nr:MAG: hypothetical protein EPN20_07075 [Magnetospirillum sp.]
MTKLSFVLAAVGTASVAFAPFAAAGAESTGPCEEMYYRLDIAVKAAMPSGADMAAIEALKKKGITACMRNQDIEADGFFQQAIDIAKKK